MAWYADLTPCTYFGPELADCLCAVGWLERGRAFPTGPVEPVVYTRLKELLTSPWQPMVCMGGHTCDLCLYEGSYGFANLFLPTATKAIVAPELIAHYMNAHGYRPPDEFCEAVLACPPMATMPYWKAMTACARPLVHLGKG